MLTTLLLRFFKGMRLKFVPEAKCYTIVPNSFSVWLSQRRRWINSTFHNTIELLQIRNQVSPPPFFLSITLFSTDLTTL